MRSDSDALIRAFLELEMDKYVSFDNFYHVLVPLCVFSMV